ncbi:vascular cell adhesion protein 1 [Chanos chanos]|uniref:Vascular cell adhesion protein 1 n=1 Tax=Chanos chanos TaxID=29144 RepID=A0A6J2VCV3_CHACN|nr:vascular cell adhesion protein 1-like [Chanos chanos]
MQAVSLFWILIVPTTAFRVKVSPQKAVRHVGDALKLTCTQTVCPDDQLTWGTATDIPLFGNLKDKEYVINNLTLGHNIRIYCKAFCQNEKGQGSAEIKVYPFPEGPEISGTEGLRVGEEKSINCSLRAVARDYKVDIEWLLGNKVLHRYTDLNKSDSEDTRNVYSVYKLNTSVQDNGETLTCRANLSLESNNRLVGESSRRLTVSCMLTVYISQLINY